MVRAFRFAVVLFLFLYLVPVAGCVHRLNRRSSSPPPESFEPILFNPGEYKTRVAKLEDLSMTHADSTVRARASRELALILSHPDNPDRDYRRAGREMKTYVENTFEKERPPEAGHLSFLLSELALLKEEQQVLKSENDALKELAAQEREESRAIQFRNEQLTERVQKLGDLYSWLTGLRRKIETLTEENEKMRTALEEMKSLDLWLDEQKGRLK